MNTSFVLLSLSIGLLSGTLINISLGEKPYQIGGLCAGVVVGILAALM